MLSVLKGVKSRKYRFGKMQTIINYLKFHEYSTDYVISLDDPMPAVSELMALLKRKTSAI
jgi:hypothetical protein